MNKHFSRNVLKLRREPEVHATWSMWILASWVYLPTSYFISVDFRWIPRHHVLLWNSSSKQLIYFLRREHDKKMLSVWLCFQDRVPRVVSGACKKTFPRLGASLKGNLSLIQLTGQWFTARIMRGTPLFTARTRSSYHFGPFYYSIVLEIHCGDVNLQTLLSVQLHCESDIFPSNKNPECEFKFSSIPCRTNSVLEVRRTRLNTRTWQQDMPAIQIFRSPDCCSYIKRIGIVVAPKRIKSIVWSWWSVV